MTSRVHLAGPDLFLSDAVDVGRRKAELCERHGLIGPHLAASNARASG
jgi:nucleoside 2-deoxyribosyltransferase